MARVSLYGALKGLCPAASRQNGDDTSVPVFLDDSLEISLDVAHAAGTGDWLAAHRLEHATWNPNWPVYAAKTLGGPDPLDLLPKTYAWWLRRREEVRRLYPTDKGAP